MNDLLGTQDVLQNLPVWALYVLLIWELCWKGFALWKAARNNHNYWFIAILILNTLGLLPIVYIFFFSKKPKTTK